ncbi:hypothetical protein LG202_25340 [Methylobacillus methanolivorans]
MLKKTVLSVASAAALLAAIAAPAFAASSFYLVVPVPTAAKAPVEAITVSLAGAALPKATVNKSYSESLRPYLSVTGDAAFDSAAARWSLVEGALPAGLSLDATTGAVAGTPTAKMPSPASFTVLASYKGQNGQAVYTIEVGGQVLQVSKIAAGGYHTCAVTTAGGLKCWGFDGYGQLGNDAALTNQPTPMDVLGLTSGVVSVAAGIAHTCAVTMAGGLKCWGLDNNGQLGNDAAFTSQPTPVDVLGMTSGVASVTAGDNHTCAVASSGGLKCWGYNINGQLGNDAAFTSQPTPVDVLGMTSGVASVTAKGNHTCAVTSSGGLKCWGYNINGQLGNDAAFTSQPTPVDVLGMTSGVASVAAGNSHTCAVTSTGGLKCWGNNSFGQLGNDAALTKQPTPVDVLGMTSGVASVAAGVLHTCAVTKAGGLKCWGGDSYGQLGNDAALTKQPTPVDVLGMTSGVASVAAGGYHTCAVTTAGGLKCWGGDNYGQLGDDTALTNQPAPVDVVP